MNLQEDRNDKRAQETNKTGAYLLQLRSTLAKKSDVLRQSFPILQLVTNVNDGIAQFDGR